MERVRTYLLVDDIHGVCFKRLAKDYVHLERLISCDEALEKCIGHKFAVFRLNDNDFWTDLGHRVHVCAPAKFKPVFSSIDNN